jgi:histidyl-tRNA synthetase
VLDCKNQHCQKIYKDAPKLINSLCNECEEEFKQLQKLLQKEGVDFEIDSNLVRGLDYYTKTAFEFISGDIGAQNAVAGGGRYDNLVELLGGKPTPAVGFAIGIERILDLIEYVEHREGYYIGVLIDEALEEAFSLAIKLRENHKAIFEYKTKSLKAHLKAADKANCKYALIIGEDELEKGLIWIKDLEKKEERKIEKNNLLEL